MNNKNKEYFKEAIKLILEDLSSKSLEDLTDEEIDKWYEKTCLLALSTL